VKPRLAALCKEQCHRAFGQVSAWHEAPGFARSRWTCSRVVIDCRSRRAAPGPFGGLTSLSFGIHWEAKQRRKPASDGEVAGTVAGLIEPRKRVGEALVGGRHPGSGEAVVFDETTVGTGLVRRSGGSRLRSRAACVRRATEGVRGHIADPTGSRKRCRRWVPSGGLSIAVPARTERRSAFSQTSSPKVSAAGNEIAKWPHAVGPKLQDRRQANLYSRSEHAP